MVELADAETVGGHRTVPCDGEVEVGRAALVEKSGISVVFPDDEAERPCSRGILLRESGSSPVAATRVIFQSGANGTAPPAMAKSAPFAFTLPRHRWATE